MDLLITGGAGFIGSTVASAALDAGHRPIILDNLVTGRREFTEGRIFYEGDIADRALLERVFDDFPDIEAVIHCAALIIVPDSVAAPIDYYRANVSKTLEMVDVLNKRGCRRLIFSSSASIYAVYDDFTVDESSDVAPLSPYARTKVHVEQMLEDIATATDLKVLSLRYFNPIGADPKMRTGLQIPSPSHALGKLIQIKREGEPFQLTGNDYPTRDGTGIRDYVHVWDLAQAHLAALDRFDKILESESHRVVNLGTGTGTTVKELVAAFAAVTGEPVDVVPAPRRPGDSAGAYTRSDRAAVELGWTPRYSIEQGIADSLAWIEKRPSILRDLALPAV
ncbi:UDP-glucose 4-epimerase GalE [Streptomyces atratus]|uniref:UDP-glucose 4-epimerase GalE n=1 Tax=Streptomyces atratus TaxID=1893 RepID=UPI00166F6ECA|nr:UDP-glucose 4-epimerase GalE [Streptomyces atratus]GGT56040.1 UDP-glucose 4-epimerase GalE [Streptomyces atratus]